MIKQDLEANENRLFVLDGHKWLHEEVVKAAMEIGNSAVVTRRYELNTKWQPVGSEN